MLVAFLVSDTTSLKEARVSFDSWLQRILSQLESMAELREPEACGTPSSGLPRVQRAGNSVHHPTCSTVPFYLKGPQPVGCCYPHPAIYTLTPTSWLSLPLWNTHNIPKNVSPRKV